MTMTFEEADVFLKSINREVNTYHFGQLSRFERNEGKIVIFNDVECRQSTMTSKYERTLNAVVVKCEVLKGRDTDILTSQTTNSWGCEYFCDIDEVKGNPLKEIVGEIV